jgi:hypothetical protein
MRSNAAGMSRARFAEHFRKIVGVTPGDYLTQWRLAIKVWRPFIGCFAAVMVSHQKSGWIVRRNGPHKRPALLDERDRPPVPLIDGCNLQCG